MNSAHKSQRMFMVQKNNQTGQLGTQADHITLKIENFLTS